MMKNKKGTIILSIILAVQFIIPLSVWGYEIYKNKELNEKGREVKLVVDSVFCDHRGIIFRNYDFDSFDKIAETKNAIKNKGVKVYIADKAANEPDPDTDNLSEDDLLLIENLYKEYEKLK